MGLRFRVTPSEYQRYLAERRADSRKARIEMLTAPWVVAEGEIMVFQPATKKETRARIGLIGPSGSGKTFTALRMALALAQGGKIAVIDTENRTASKYVGEEVPEGTIRFDVLELDVFSPTTYEQAIVDAAAGGYAVLIIDSLSHAWMGKEGALEQVDNAAARMRGNKFGAWREVTPMHNRMVDAIVRAPMHIIATMRSKTEYAVEPAENGKTRIRKLGLAPVQRDGLEYEFDVVGDMEVDTHKLIVSKTRCRALDGKVIKEPGGDVAQIILDWLSDGEASDQADAETLMQIREIAVDLNLSEMDLRRGTEKYFGIATPDYLSKDQAEELKAKLLAKKNGK